MSMPLSLSLSLLLSCRPTFYLLGASVNVSHLHQLADHFHSARTIRCRQSGKHNGRIASIVLKMNVTRTWKG